MRDERKGTAGWLGRMLRYDEGGSVDNLERRVDFGCGMMRGCSDFLDATVVRDWGGGVGS